MGKLTLKKLKFHEDMSEETPCFSADLYEDGKLIAHVSNRGHGGCNDVRAADGLSNKDIAHIYDMDIDCEIMTMAEELNIVKKNQSKGLVLKRGEQYSTVKLIHSIAKLKKEPNYPMAISQLVKKWEDQGFEVLNTNL